MSAEIFDWEKHSPEFMSEVIKSGAPYLPPRSLGLDLCNWRGLLSPEELKTTREGLAGLALQRRLDAPSPVDTNKLV